MECSYCGQETHSDSDVCSICYDEDEKYLDGLLDSNYSDLEKNVQDELNEVFENINVVTDEAVFLETPSNHKDGFFYKLLHDEAKAITFVSPCINSVRVRPDNTFACDVFKDGNYWQMWMNQEQIDEARSTGFTVNIDSKDPQMYEGWQGLHLAGLDGKGFEDEYLCKFSEDEK